MDLFDIALFVVIASAAFLAVLLVVMLVRGVADLANLVRRRRNPTATTIVSDPAAEELVDFVAR